MMAVMACCGQLTRAWNHIDVVALNNTKELVIRCREDQTLEGSSPKEPVRWSHKISGNTVPSGIFLMTFKLIFIFN